MLSSHCMVLTYRFSHAQPTQSMQRSVVVLFNMHSTRFADETRLRFALTRCRKYLMPTLRSKMHMKANDIFQLRLHLQPIPMADDTRQPNDKEISIRDFNANPENKAFAGEQWKEEKAKYYKPPQNANVLAGGTENTAGGKLPEVSIGAAFDGGVKLSDFTELPKRPCVKDSSINAMIAAFAMGGLRTVFGCELCRVQTRCTSPFPLTQSSTDLDRRQLGRWHLLRGLFWILHLLRLQTEGIETRHDARCRNHEQERDREGGTTSAKAEGEGTAEAGEGSTARRAICGCKRGWQRKIVVEVLVMGGVR